MIYVGTSGYYYNHWRVNFYPETIPKSKWLDYYSHYFNTVELNVTFYRLPNPKAFNTWNAQSPNNFVFAVKGSRYITHRKKLLDIEEPIRLFFERAEILQSKLGVVLWQFPSNYHFNLERFDNFLKLLKKYHKKNAFEFRHESWFNKQCYELLEKCNYSLVIADSQDYPSHDVFTANYVYVRFHGGKRIYGSDYSKQELDKWAEKIRNWTKTKDVFIYFNNDAFGFAVKDARYLKEKLT